MYVVSCLSLGLNLNSNLDSNVIRYGFTDTWHTLLTHWGRAMHICVTKLTIIGSDNCLSPGRCQPIVWTNAEILLIGPYEQISVLIEIQTFHWRKSICNCRMRIAGHCVSASMCEIVTCRWQSYDIMNFWHMRATLPCVYLPSCRLPATSCPTIILKTHDDPFKFMSKFKLASNVRKLITLFLTGVQYDLYRWLWHTTNNVNQYMACTLCFLHMCFAH